LETGCYIAEEEEGRGGLFVTDKNGFAAEEHTIFGVA
jgi:hypothetical protein